MIAYFILVHHKRQLFERLIQAIYDPKNFYLIHVDAKADDEIFGAAKDVSFNFSNVKLLNSRFIGWGAWSMVQVELDAIKYLLNENSEWTHLINLSGQDMPLVSQSKIDEILNSHPLGSNYIHLEKMGANDRRISLGQYFVEDCGEIKMMGERKPFEDYFALGIEAYRGSQWKIISRSFAEFSVSSPLAFDMQDYFRYALIPDELYFPTLLMNSNFARTHISRNYRFILYERRENGFAGPVNLTIDNIQDLIMTDDLFARKFDDVDVVESLLERLAPLGGAAATLLKQLSCY